MVVFPFGSCRCVPTFISLLIHLLIQATCERTGAVAVSIWTMACKRTLGSVKSVIYEFVPTPEEKTAQQFAKAQAQANEKQKVPVGVRADGGEEKVQQKKEL